MKEKWLKNQNTKSKDQKKLVLFLVLSCELRNNFIYCNLTILKNAGADLHNTISFDTPYHPEPGTSNIFKHPPHSLDSASPKT
jgi:hypothetical protein